MYFCGHYLYYLRKRYYFFERVEIIMRKMQNHKRELGASKAFYSIPEVLRLPNLNMKNYRKRAVGVSMCVALGLFVVPAIGNVVGVDSGYTRASAEVLYEDSIEVREAETLKDVFNTTNQKPGNYTINVGDNITFYEEANLILDNEKSTVKIIGNGHTIKFNRLNNNTSQGCIQVNKGHLILGDGKTSLTLTGSTDEEYYRFYYENILQAGNTKSSETSPKISVDIMDKVSLKGTYDVAINEYKNNFSGRGISIYSGTVNMYGGEITGFRSPRPEAGGGVIIGNSGVLNLYGGSIHGNGSDLMGGGVCVDASTDIKDYGTLNIYGGSITNNRSSNGGGIYSRGHVYMYGGGISSNIGNGIMTDGTFNMYGGIIEKNSGNGIFDVTSGELNIHGGSISENVGHGVYSIYRYDNNLPYYTFEKSLNISSKRGVATYTNYDGKEKKSEYDGKIIIAGNNDRNLFIYYGFNQQRANGFNLQRANLIANVGEIYEGSEIHVYPAKYEEYEEFLRVNEIFARPDEVTDLSKYKRFFKSDIPGYHIGMKNGGLALIEGSDPSEGGSSTFIPSDSTPQNPDDTTIIGTGFGNTKKPDITNLTPSQISSLIYSSANTPGIRIAGDDRIATAIKVSQKNFKSSDYVVIADAKNFPDALSSSVLAKNLKSPILLTNGNVLDDRVKAEIKRLGAKNIVIVGGENSISTSTQNALSQIANLRRIEGADRYATSAKVAEEVFKMTGKTDKIVIASGENFPDSLSVGGYAAKNDYPILLVKKNTAPNYITNIIADKKVKDFIVMGGKNTISDESANKVFDVVKKNVEAENGAINSSNTSSLTNTSSEANSTSSTNTKSYERISGSDRYQTALKLAEKNRTDKVIVVSGENFADALVVGPVAGLNDQNILLTKKSSVSNTVKKFVDNTVKFIDVVGGKNSVSDDVIIKLLK